MKLCRATADDVARLALVGAASFLETFAHDHPGDATVSFIHASHSQSAWATTLARPGTSVWIVEEAAGCPIGYAVLGRASLPGTGPQDAELKRIYLLSRWHGTGMGQQLFEVAQSEARAWRAGRLVLSVYRRNARAIRFYERQGFAVIGETIFPGFPEEFSDHVMAKPL